MLTPEPDGAGPSARSGGLKLTYIRHDLMTKGRMERDEKGKPVWREPHTEQEAKEVIREAFQLAKAQANVRTE
jgi:hypothetical protein